MHCSAPLSQPLAATKVMVEKNTTEWKYCPNTHSLYTKRPSGAELIQLNMAPPKLWLWHGLHSKSQLPPACSFAHSRYQEAVSHLPDMRYI